MRQKFGVDEHIEKVGWEHCCISEVTVAELLFGAERSNNVERNLQLVTDFCQDIKVIPLSSALCCYARSKAALYSQGTPIEDLDRLISGCAMHWTKSMLRSILRVWGTDLCRKDGLCRRE